MKKINAFFDVIMILAFALAPVAVSILCYQCGIIDAVLVWVVSSTLTLIAIATCAIVISDAVNK